MNVLKEHELFVKYRKCMFWFRSVAFHCHIISSEGVEIDPTKIEAVKNRPISLNTMYIIISLGLPGYFRGFVMGLDTLVPL